MRRSAAPPISMENYKILIELTETIVRIMKANKWGFIRETKAKAEKAGIDKDTGMHRTGLEEYLSVIFPEVETESWVHDKKVEGCKSNIRPDYQCEKLRLIIEFDGLQHYQKPDRIKKDYENQKIYEDMGYKVVRIPYFIQLTNEVVAQMFGRTVDVPLFDPSIPSMGIKGVNTPAYCCPAGLVRMAREFKNYPQQYEVNMKALIEANDDYLTGASLLKIEYEKG